MIFDLDTKVGTRRMGALLKTAKAVHVTQGRMTVTTQGFEISFPQPEGIPAGVWTPASVKEWAAGIGRLSADFSATTKRSHIIRNPRELSPYAGTFDVNQGIRDIATAASRPDSGIPSLTKVIVINHQALATDMYRAAISAEVWKGSETWAFPAEMLPFVPNTMVDVHLAPLSEDGYHHAQFSYNQPGLGITVVGPHADHVAALPRNLGESIGQLGGNNKKRISVDLTEIQKLRKLVADRLRHYVLIRPNGEISLTDQTGEKFAHLPLRATSEVAVPLILDLELLPKVDAGPVTIEVSHDEDAPYVKDPVTITSAAGNKWIVFTVRAPAHTVSN